MQSFRTNDNVTIKYIDTGLLGGGEDLQKPLLMLIHGFTGSSAVWQRNIPSLSKEYRVIAPDLRGHGDSDKCRHGYQVMRLAKDLRELVLLFEDPEAVDSKQKLWKAVGGSLGCSILWCYASLFTTNPFTHMVFVDQSPLQNSDPTSGWDHRFCNRSMNNALALSSFQTTLALSPATAHRGTIAACLSYLAYPLPTDIQTSAERTSDEEFFLREAMKGDPWWYGKLMADHTALDWRHAIQASFGPGSGSTTKVLVIASTRSGCFPSAGPITVAGLVNDGAEEKRAKRVVVHWGGHWLYWEGPERFARMCLEFFGDLEVVDA
ncbi:uncharacterized protein BP5553_07536 [Venustampulla echinocandica]|uniref:AB hydrolase-1 domain-containing protein n=1 Tax=Venustampulla echinocandica TaxID=2656787 RepID=A0A370TGT6_9HELO|nr:uncharacterized protein BP5553_07536 [Venustampulla echinocandica]RDL34408.1 hypothetical protein BP5553_07536 [Venustampulla echinocandica]